MFVKKSVFEVIEKSVTNLRYETGGILGARDEIITEIVMDLPKTDVSPACSYEPNVDFLNDRIAKWGVGGIAFQGVFHTHFANVKTLSSADEEYIYSIMCAMPPSINKLYFPVFTLPDCKLTGYSATKHVDKVIIDGELVEIVE